MPDFCPRPRTRVGNKKSNILKRSQKEFQTTQSYMQRMDTSSMTENVKYRQGILVQQPSINSIPPKKSTECSHNPMRNTSRLDDNKRRNTLQAYNCNGKRNNGKRRIGSLLDGENKTNVDNHREEIVQHDNQMFRQTKKVKHHRVISEADDGPAGDQNHLNFEDDTCRSMPKDANTFVPLDVEKQTYCCSKPIDEPTWRGNFKMGEKYVSLAGHLSTKCGEKVWKLSKSLRPIVEVTKLSRSKVWPKVWDSSKPNGENIGLYFFPHEMRPNEELDRLLKEVMDNDLALRAIISDAEMLIFPSFVLPQQYKTFRGKHYLWGVYKPKEHKGVAVAERPDTIRCSIKAPVEKESQCFSINQDEMCCKGKNQEKILMKSTSPLKNQDLSAKTAYEVQATNVQGTRNMGLELKAHEDEEGKQGDALHWTMCIAEAVETTRNGVTLHPNQGQINRSRGIPSGRVLGFVAEQTPRLVQLIQEIQREGGVVIAMQGQTRGVGPSTTGLDIFQ